MLLSIQVHPAGRVVPLGDMQFAEQRKKIERWFWCLADLAPCSREQPQLPEDTIRSALLLMMAVV
jgi:hypothetical protein